MASVELQKEEEENRLVELKKDSERKREMGALILIVINLLFYLLLYHILSFIIQFILFLNIFYLSLISKFFSSAVGIYLLHL